LDPPPPQVTKYVEAEIVNHSLMRHPHVIQFKEVFLTHRFICIVMEYATGGSLFQYVQRQGRLMEAVARWFFQQLVVGVDYCHRKGVANRDIKLENTLLQVSATLAAAAYWQGREALAELISGGVCVWHA
jgi:serine/threonine-protein kinase SRK2